MVADPICARCGYRFSQHHYLGQDVLALLSETRLCPTAVFLEKREERDETKNSEHTGGDK